MADFQLLIGYRTVSPWPLRAWLAMRKVGVPFEETLIRYRRADGKARLLELSPTGKVPYLIHRRPEGTIGVWESLAICEYLVECFPEARLWPADPAARAYARSASAEMHSGFRPLRDHLSMALLERHPGVGLDGPGVPEDIARIAAIWREAREKWGGAGGGPYLFGHFTIADAMFAPVAARFRTYGVVLDPACQAYADAILADPDFRYWEEAAVRELPLVDPLTA